MPALPPKQRDLARVFQSYALYLHMTVRQNIGLPLEMRGLSAWPRIPALYQILLAMTCRTKRPPAAGAIGPRPPSFAV